MTTFSSYIPSGALDVVRVLSQAAALSLVGLILSDVTTALKQNGALLKRLREIFVMSGIVVVGQLVGLIERLTDFLPALDLEGSLYRASWLVTVGMVVVYWRFWKALHAVKR